MTPLVMVTIVAVVLFAPLGIVGLDLLLERDTARRQRLANRQLESAWVHAYTTYVENCTRLGKTAPLPGAFGKRR